MEIKFLLGGGSIVLALIGYIPYVRDIAAGKTRPHAFSWLVWAVLSVIAFIVQILNDAGAGAWVTGLTTMATLTIFALSLKKGETNILLADWISLFAAAIALVPWFFTKNPLYSVLIVSGIDTVGGFFPTFRKSFYKPYEETASLYFIYAISLGFSLAALRRFNLINALYPAVIAIINLSMVAYLWIRRRQLSSRSASDT